MQEQVMYKSETKIVPFGNGTIRFTDCKPILAPKEYEMRRREAEQRLFDILSKYVDM